MTEHDNADLLKTLAGARNSDELQSLVERHLTKLDMKFEIWFNQLLVQVKATNPSSATQLERLMNRINEIADASDYHRAVFDEATPANCREAVLALARRIARNELVPGQDDVIIQAALAQYTEAQLVLTWLHFSERIVASKDQAAYLPIAELLYRYGRDLPELANHYMPHILILTLDTEGMRLRDRHEFDAALAAYARLAELAEQANMPREQALGLLSMGDVCLLQLPKISHPDRFILGERYLRKALDLYETHALDNKLRADVQLQLGRTLDQQGRSSEACHLLEQCLLLWRTLEPPRPDELGNCLLHLAVACSHAGYLHRQVECLREALTLSTNNQQRLGILNNLGFALGHLGDPSAEQVLLEGIRIADNEAHPHERASMRSSIYAHLADYRTRQGALQSAFDAYRVAYLAALEAGDEQAGARWLNSLSHLSMILGKWDDAYKMLEEASKIHERLGDRQAQAFAALAYARVYLFTRRLNEAGRYAAQAYALFYNEQRPGDMAAAADILGLVYIHKGDLACAEACVRYALAKSEASATRPYRCRALGQLADLAAKQGRLAEALNLYEGAVALARELGTLMLEADIVGDRANLHLERQDLPAAESDYRRAIEIADLVRGGLRTVDRRMHIQHMATNDYAGLIRLLVQQSERVGVRQDALNLAERARSRTLAEMLSRTSIPYPESLPPDLAAREAALLLQLRQSPDDQDGEAGQQIAEINRELEALWDAMVNVDASCQRYADLRRLPTVQLDNIRELLIDGYRRATPIVL